MAKWNFVVVIELAWLTGTDHYIISSHPIMVTRGGYKECTIYPWSSMVCVHVIL